MLRANLQQPQEPGRSCIYKIAGPHFTWQSNMLSRAATELTSLPRSASIKVPRSLSTALWFQIVDLSYGHAEHYHGDDARRVSQIAGDDFIWSSIPNRTLSPQAVRCRTKLSSKRTSGLPLMLCFRRRSQIIDVRDVESSIKIFAGHTVD